MASWLQIILYLFLIFVLLTGIPAYLRGVFHKYEIITPESVPNDTNGIQYVGHATLLIQLDGVRILTDPILTKRIAGGVKRFVSLGIDTTDLPSINAVLISHWHADHFQMRSMKMLKREVQLFVPKGLKKRLKRNGFTNIQEVKPGEAYTLNSVRIHIVPTEHPSAKGAIGYVISGTKTLYFPGDTALAKEKMSAIGKQFDIDVAFIPIGCFQVKLMSLFPVNISSIHMGPREMPLAMDYIKPKVAIPIHWGTFIIGTEPIHIALELLESLLKSNPLDVKIVKHGNWFQI
jgi:L-ascorbate metabolism protein UlaG (beta-lactamase superfamily)